MTFDNLKINLYHTEKEITMFTPIKAWIGFFILYFGIGTILFFLAKTSGSVYVVSFSVVWAILLLVFIIWSWNVITHQHQWIIEFFGKYTGEPLHPGLKFIFPLFTTLRSNNYMGEQIMELYLDEKENDLMGGGVVDFKDASAPVEAKAFIQIKDSALATYEISNVFKGIEERLDSALRAFLANYTIDEAGSLKTYFKVGIILNGILVEKKEGQPVCYRDVNGEEVSLKPGNDSTIILSDGTEKKPAVLKEIEKWGVTVNTIVITDVILSNEIRTQRRKVLEEDQKAQAAKFTKQAIITASEGALQVAKNKADGEEYAFDQRGRGMRKQLKNVSKAGLSGKEASDHITKTKLYENIGDKAVILETSGTAVGQGAHIGAGAAAISSVVNNQNQTSPSGS